MFEWDRNEKQFGNSETDIAGRQLRQECSQKGNKWRTENDTILIEVAIGLANSRVGMEGSEMESAASTIIYRKWLKQNLIKSNIVSIFVEKT